MQATYPFERVGIDIVGPLPTTSRENRYILVIADYFSKWCEAFALKKQEADTVARVVVEQFILRWGTPKSIHTDQGKNFESALFREICDLLEIQKTRTTPYHPQSDGLVERVNRTVTTMLSMFVHSNQRNWDELLPYVMMAYRSSIQASIKFSPYHVLFGREIVMPSDLLFNVEVNKPYVSVGGYVRELEGRLQSVHEAICKHQQEASRGQKKFYDLRVRGPKYEVGDKVWLRDKARKRGRCPKFQRHYTGPYKIKEKLSEELFKLSSQGRPVFVAHYNRLKLCTVPSLPGVQRNAPREQRDGVPEETQGSHQRTGGVGGNSIVPAWGIRYRAQGDVGPLETAGDGGASSLVSAGQGLMGTVAEQQLPTGELGSDGLLAGLEGSSGNGDGLQEPSISETAGQNISHAIGADAPQPPLSRRARVLKAPAWQKDYVVDL
uniref:Integrase catalytic domain-containing protein n=1 Tax=Pygocentrus nattereri TaxID=42514 RepID=A0AAR2LYA0_PYGNA